MRKNFVKIGGRKKNNKNNLVGNFQNSGNINNKKLVVKFK